MTPSSDESGSNKVYFELNPSEKRSKLVIVSETSTAVNIKDAFLYYSNDKNRMRKLKLLKDEDSSKNATRDTADVGAEEVSSQEHHVVSTKRTQQQVERKTRISFELYPDLILEDVLYDRCDKDSDDCSDEYGANGIHSEDDETLSGTMERLEQMSADELFAVLLGK